MKKTLVMLLVGFAAHAQPISAPWYCKFFGRFHTARCSSVLNGWWILKGGVGTYVPASGTALQAINQSTGDVRQVSVTRASNQSCHDNTGTIKTLSNNIPCVETSGFLVEIATTNVFLNSGVPATQTISVTTANNGKWTASFDNGAGNIAYAVGTATATGLPCTVTAGRSGACTFTVTVNGTVTATVTGTTNGPQLENIEFETSYVPTAGSPATRAAQTNSFTSPLTSGSTFYLATNLMTEGFLVNGYQIELSAGANTSANSWWFGIPTAGLFEQITVYDSSAVQHFSQQQPGISTAKHRYGGQDASGSAVTLFDGVVGGNQATGATVLTQQTPIYVGNLNGSFQSNGWLTDVCVSNLAAGCF